MIRQAHQKRSAAVLKLPEPLGNHGFHFVQRLGYVFDRLCLAVVNPLNFPR